MSDSKIVLTRGQYNALMAGLRLLHEELRKSYDGVPMTEEVQEQVKNLDDAHNLLFSATIRG